MRGRIPILAMAIAACATRAFAQTPLSLTLEDAISRAVAEAPRVAEARARQAAAASTVSSRRALGAPSLSATSGFLRTNHVEPFGIPEDNGRIRVLFPDVPNNYQVRAELGVPLFTNGRVSAAVASSEADARAQADDVRVAEEDVRLDVSRAYWTLVTARELVKVLETGLQRMDAWVSDVEARRAAGVLPPNDVLTAQAQRARQNVQLIQARNSAAYAEVDLARLIGVELDQPIVTATPPDRPLAAAADALTQPVGTLVIRAVQARAERAGLIERQAVMRANADAASASMKPQVGAVASVEPARPNQRFVPRLDEWNTSWDLGVNLVVPLWDGGRARADRAAALAQSDAIAQRVREFDAAVGAEVRQRVLDIASNRAALGAAGEAIAAATEARRVVGERFNAGVATPTDVLDAQNAVLQAELEQLQITAALRLGEARLLRTLGAL